MKKLKRNIIVLLVFGLILSVNYGAYADSVLDDQVSVPEEETKEIINLGNTVEDSAVEDDSSNLETEDNEEELETENQESKTQDNQDTKEEVLEETNAKQEQSDKETVQQENIQEVSSEQTVSNWDEFFSAYNDEAVTKITLENDLKGNSDLQSFGSRFTSLEIQGNNHEINTVSMGSFDDSLFKLSFINQAESFTLNNINIRHIDNSIIETDNNSNENKLWTIKLSGFVAEESGLQTNIITGENIKEIIIGDYQSYSSAKAIFSEGAKLHILNTEKFQSNSALETKTVKIENSNVELRDHVKAVKAKNGIEIINSTVRISSDLTGLITTSTSDENIGIRITDDSNIEIETGNGPAITSLKIFIEESNIQIKSGDKGIESEQSEFKNVNFSIHTAQSALVSPKIAIFDSKGKISSDKSAIEARSLNNSVNVKINQSKLDFIASEISQNAVINLSTKDEAGEVGLWFNGGDNTIKSYSKSNSNFASGVSLSTDTDKTSSNSCTDSSGLIFNQMFDSKVTIDVFRGTGLYFNSKTKSNLGVFQNSELYINQEIGSSYDTAALKMVDGCSQSIQLEGNSNIDIDAGAGESPAVSLENAPSRTFNMSRSVLKIHNPGDGEDKNKSNEGIRFINNDGRPGENIFVFYGQGAFIEVVSDHGPAVLGSDTTKISTEEGVGFAFEGTTASQTSPVFDTKEFLFNAEGPLYFNIQNKRKGGGAIFPKLEDTSVFNVPIRDVGTGSTAVSVWKHGEEIENDPSKFWSKLKFRLKGSDLLLNYASESEMNTEDDSFGDKGLTAYSRISGNNAKPVINFTPDSYNTDKSIYGHVTVPEGLNGSRNAWEGEVQLELERTQADEIKTVYDDISTLKSEGQAWGYEDYKIPKEQWGGYFKIDLDGFAVADDKYEIISAYRGQKDQEEERHIHSDLTEKEVTKKTIKDITPPKIADIDEPVFEDQTSMGGKTSEKDITAKLYDKDEHEIKDKDGDLLEVSDNDGVWEFDISNTDLKKGEKVYVVLKDKIGNFNPFKESTYHDATFEAAASIIISGPRFEISAEDLFTNQKGIVKISNKDNLKTKMKAKGRDNLKEEEIEVEISDLGGLEFEQSETINEVKSHKITFKLKDRDTTVIKSVHILPHDNIVQTSQYVIGASDFYTDKSDIDATEERVKELANAKAYKKEDMSEQDVRLKDFEKLQFDLPNKLKFVVKADETVKVTVIGRVLNYDHVNNSDEYVVAANDFGIMDYLAVDIEDQTILDRSKAAGWIIEGWQEKDVKVVKHNVEGTVGQYKATIDIVK